MRGLVMASVTLLLLAGCGGATDSTQSADGTASDGAGSPDGSEVASSSAPASSPAGELVPLTFRSAFGPSGALMAPFSYADELGLYADEGLDVTIEDGSGSLLTAQDVAAGNTDVGLVGGSAAAQGIDSGMEIISVGMLYGRSSFGVIVPDDAGIASLQELAGHSVVTSPGSPETIMLPAALRKENVDQSQVSIISVDASAKVSTYIGGQGDTLGTAVPFFMPIIGDTRPSSGLLFEDVGAGFPDFSLVVRRETLQDQPEMIASFLRATYDGLDAALEDPSAAVGSLAAIRETMDNLPAQTQQLANYEDFVCSEEMSGQPVGWHAEEDWTAGLVVLQEFGNVNGDVEDLSQFYTNEFFEGPDTVSEQTCP